MNRQGIARGDTLVEVIMSFAVFSVVAVSVSVLMSRGLGIGQQSLELALVREQMSSQAEMLRFARYDTSNEALWAKIKDATSGSVSPSERPSDCDTPPTGSAFILHPSSSQLAYEAIDADNYVPPQTSSFVDDSGNAEGLWIQAAKAEDASGDNVSAYDFYIHACWYAPSNDAPQTLVTVVRLYDGN